MERDCRAKLVREGSETKEKRAGIGKGQDQSTRRRGVAGRTIFQNSIIPANITRD